MALDYRQLMYLLAIAECGSFSRAAKQLQMSQPALSNSIALFEERLKTKVLTRGRSGAELTQAGRVLARHAGVLQTQMARALEELEFQREAHLGPLTIGVTPVAAANLVPRALNRLKREMPTLAVRINETVFHAGMDALLKGTLDLMVGPVGVYAPVPEIAERRLMFDPFSLVVRSRHVLAKRRSVSLKQIKDFDWVLPSDQSAFHKQLEALFVVAGIGWPKHAIATNSVIAMKAIVTQADCIAIMPRQLVANEQKAGLLHCIRLVEAGASRALGISWVQERKLTGPAEAFVRCLEECATARS